MAAGTAGPQLVSGPTPGRPERRNGDGSRFRSELEPGQASDQVKFDSGDSGPALCSVSSWLLRSSGSSGSALALTVGAERGPTSAKGGRQAS